MSNIYPAGVCEHTAPWNQPEPWEEETCGSCYYHRLIMYEMVDGRISKLKHPIDVCATDLNDMFLCDPDQPACEDWER